MWMSVAYFMGWGVPEDEAEGVAWLRKAAKRGHAPAQVSLGRLYELGNFLREDLFFAVSPRMLAGIHLTRCHPICRRR